VNTHLEQRLQVRCVFLRSRNSQNNDWLIAVLLRLLVIVLLLLRMLLLVSLIAALVLQLITLRRLNLNVGDCFVHIVLPVGLLFGMCRCWWDVLARL
jgi:hypothetical protein